MAEVMGENPEKTNMQNFLPDNRTTVEIEDFHKS